MMYNAYFLPSPAAPNECVAFDETKCIGCNTCINVCRCDVMLPNPEKGKQPIVTYPDECWFCGACVSDCPVQGAIRMNHPINQRIAWKRKETGEIFRVKYSYMK